MLIHIKNAKDYNEVIKVHTIIIDKNCLLPVIFQC